jgi:hypothetical protein
MPAALPTDHDDDALRSPRSAPPCAWTRSGLRTSTTTRRCGGRWSTRLAGPDTLHDPDHLSPDGADTRQTAMIVVLPTKASAYLVRFADDFVGSFQFRGDAQNFQRQLRERFAQSRTDPSPSVRKLQNRINTSVGFRNSLDLTAAPSREFLNQNHTSTLNLLVWFWF